MASPREQVSVALFAGILFCSLVAGSVGALAAGSDGPGPNAATSAEAGFGDLSAEAFEADRTRFEITVYENGSAEWLFRYEQRLDSDDAIADFERYAARFNTEDTETYRNFRNRSSSLARSGRDATERNMTATSFAREARVEERSPSGEEFAVIEMSFVWTEFAERDGDRLVVGDVFVGGLYVGPDQGLRFERGPTLRFESASPTPDSTAAGTLAESQSVTWLGETQFTDRHPRVIYVDRGTTEPTSTSVESPTPTESTPIGSSPGIGSFVPFLALAVVILLGAGGAIAYRSGRLSDRVDTVDSGDTDTGSGSVPGAAAVDAEDGSSAGTDATEGAPSASGDGTASEPAVPDEALLSDEERVVGLLEANGGRMKQVDIVDRTDWSKSKVSMLLSEMEEEGTISKLRVGRENIVSLTGHEPDAAGSPFDDE